ncbi:MAG TPA: efflux RND transporter periplasmic adaptor subunit, partial [Acidobacteriota bacterium]|nr:efflux RND transporter periplasmic adaptor subunit [Acidobacteriota bacterium]
MSKSRKFRLTFFVLGTVIVLAVGFIVFSNVFRSEASVPEERLTEIKRGNLALSVVATGSIEPVTTVQLKSKSSGLVQNIYKEEGDLVQEGQILIELDKELLRAQLREAEASRLAVVARQQEAESDHLSAVNMKQKLGLDVNNLEGKVAFHKKQVQRYEDLSKEKLIPHSELEIRERELQEATFSLEALRSESLMQDSRIDGAEKAVARAAAEVSQAQAILDRAAENLRNSTIRSPLTGTVLKRHVEVGDAVSSILQLGSQATLLMTLGDMAEVFFEGRVDETDIGKIFVDQQARVKVDAFRDSPFPGKVLRIAPLGEEEDNVIGFEVRVSIEDPEQILRAQMSANAEIIIEEKENILLIPENAVVYGKDRNTFAEVHDPAAENQSRRVEIEIGISDGTTTELVSGLPEGETVITT